MKRPKSSGFQYKIIGGIGYDEQASEALNPAKRRGENLLGFTLMEMRNRLIKIQDKLDAIIAMKDDDDPWPPKDYFEFCDGYKFTQMIQWKHGPKGLFA